MSISGILTSSYNQYQLGAASNPYQQDMQKLSQDLQSGNLSASQSDFAALQAAFSQPTGSTAATSTSSTSSAAIFTPITQAFNQLATDLQSGNVSAAQKDLSTLQQGFQVHGKLPIDHFHHHQHSGGGSGDSSTENSLLQDLSQVGQNLTSSNLRARSRPTPPCSRTCNSSLSAAEHSPRSRALCWRRCRFRWKPDGVGSGLPQKRKTAIRRR